MDRAPVGKWVVQSPSCWERILFKLVSRAVLERWESVRADGRRGEAAGGALAVGMDSHGKSVYDSLKKGAFRQMEEKYPL